MFNYAPMFPAPFPPFNAASCPRRPSGDEEPCPLIHQQSAPQPLRSSLSFKSLPSSKSAPGGHPQALSSPPASGAEARGSQRGGYALRHHESRHTPATQPHLQQPASQQQHNAERASSRGGTHPDRSGRLHSLRQQAAAAHQLHPAASSRPPRSASSAPSRSDSPAHKALKIEVVDAPGAAAIRQPSTTGTTFNSSEDQPATSGSNSAAATGGSPTGAAAAAAAAAQCTSPRLLQLQPAARPVLDLSRDSEEAGTTSASAPSRPDSPAESSGAQAGRTSLPASQAPQQVPPQQQAQMLHTLIANKQVQVRPLGCF